MSLEDLGNIGEFVAAIGVIASLIYLAVQIRQNTRSVRMASRHSIVAGFHDLSEKMADEPVLWEIWRKGTHDLDSLSEIDRLQLETILSWLFRVYEELYAYHEQGIIDSNF